MEIGIVATATARRKTAEAAPHTTLIRIDRSGKTNRAQARRTGRIAAGLSSESRIVVAIDDFGTWAAKCRPNYTEKIEFFGFVLPKALFIGNVVRLRSGAPLIFVKAR